MEVLRHQVLQECCPVPPDTLKAFNTTPSSLPRTGPQLRPSPPWSSSLLHNHLKHRLTPGMCGWTQKSRKWDRQKVEDLTCWCGDSSLILNTQKNKKMVVDFCKSAPPTPPPSASTEQLWRSSPLLNISERTSPTSSPHAQQHHGCAIFLYIFTYCIKFLNFYSLSLIWSFYMHQPEVISDAPLGPSHPELTQLLSGSQTPANRSISSRIQASQSICSSNRMMQDNVYFFNFDIQTPHMFIV